MEGATDKLLKLKGILAAMDGLLVAHSGGVDSTFLLAVAAEVLGERVVACTIRSPLNPPGEVEAAQRIARTLGVTHRIVDLDPLQDERIAENSPERCYYCKRAIFEELRQVAEAEGLSEIAHGEHVSDLSDHRPGQRAAEELGVRAPLAEAGLEKRDIRELSEAMGLEGWDRPAMACLASRVPYGDRLTADRLERIARAEEAIRDLGLGQVRVRDHGTVARIELPADEVARAADVRWRAEVVRRLKQAGYAYVTVDLEGFRSGSMDEVL